MWPTRIKISKPRGCSALVVVEMEKCLELMLLSVRPECRRQGVGSKAVERVKDVAKKLNKPLYLFVDRPKQRSLKKFYGKLGFVTTNVPDTGGLEMVWHPQ